MSQALRELTVSIDFNDVDIGNILRMDSALDNVEDSVRQLGGDITRMGHKADAAGAEGSRAMSQLETRTDMTGNAMRGMGNDASRAGNKVEHAANDATKELKDMGRAGDRAGDAIKEMGGDAHKLTQLTQTLDNINGRIGIQERKISHLRESLDNTFNDAKRDKLTEQILKSEYALMGLTRQSDKTAREIWDIEDSLRDAGNQGDKAGSEISDALKDVKGDASRAADAVDELGDKASKAGSEGKSGTNKFLGALDEVVPKGKTAGAASILFSNPWVLAAASVVGAIGGIALAITGMVSGAEADFDRMQAKLGYTNDQMASMKETTLDIYAKGFGENIGEVAGDVAVMKQNFKDLDNGAIEKMTSGAYVLKDLFGPEIKETSKAVKTMTANFKGLSEQDAMDLITTGFQQGGDYANDFLDTVNEYSVYFEKLGVGADKFVGTLIKGGQAGAFNLDKVGDAFKEIGIRSMDGSKETTAAFTALGFDAKKMGSDFAKGGDKAHNALMATVAALSFVDDAQEQNAIGVQLFGTQWEDMREDVIFAMDGAESAVAGFQGATERATQTLQDNAGTKWTQIVRGFKTGMMDAFSGSGGALTTLLDTVITVMPQVISGIQTAMDWVSSIFTENQTEIALYAESIGTFFTGLWNVIQGVWNLIGPFVTGVFSDALGVVWATASTVLTAVGNVFDVFGNLLQGNWSEAWTGVKNLFNDALNGVLEIGRSLLDLVFGAFDNTIGRIINLFANFSLKETGANIVNGLIDGVKSMKDMAVNTIKNVAESMWDSVKNFFGIASPSKLMMDAGQWIMEGLKKGVVDRASAAITAIKDVANDMWSGVKNFFGIKSPSRLMAEAGGFVVEGMEVGINDTAYKAIQAASNVSEGIAASMLPDKPKKPNTGGQGFDTSNPNPDYFDFPHDQGGGGGSPVMISVPVSVTIQGGMSSEDVKIARDIGDEVNRIVEEKLTTIFTQLGIAYQM